MPPAATKKDLVRTPGSQASQPEEDQYHTVSLPGRSSTFFHTDSHAENPMGFLTDKPQRGFHQEFGSSQAHSHTDIYKTNLHEDKTAPDDTALTPPALAYAFLQIQKSPKPLPMPKI